MEYQLPAEQGLACLEELLAVLKQQRVAMFFPIEFRYVKGDDIWLSPFYGRDSVSISIHQFYKQDCQHIFKWVEPILQKYQGRPHWANCTVCKRINYVSYIQNGMILCNFVSSLIHSKNGLIHI